MIRQADTCAFLAENEENVDKIIGLSISYNSPRKVKDAFLSTASDRMWWRKRIARRMVPLISTSDNKNTLIVSRVIAIRIGLRLPLQTWQQFSLQTAILTSVFNRLSEHAPRSYVSGRAARLSASDEQGKARKAEDGAW